MLAIDANVVVRYLTGDHPEQAARARAVIDNGPVFVPITVLLEVEWVLRSAYGYRASQRVQALVAFAGLRTVNLENPPTAARAFEAMEAGMDFADALHLAASDDCEAFLTFDKAFAKAAGAFGGLPIRIP